MKLITKLINPVFLTAVCALILLYSLSLKSGVSFSDALSWLVIPSTQTCNNFTGLIVIASNWASYLLLLAVLTSYLFAFNAEDLKQSIGSSLFGLITISLWLGWGVFTFLLCGFRVH